jgi:pyrophosphatase PpaX
MPTYQTILFDLDGTLIDSVDLIVDSYLHTVAVHGLPALTRQDILAGMGRPLRSIFGEWTSDPATMERWIATYREYNLTHHDARVTAYPGVVDMVRRIRTAGHRTALVTSKNRYGAERGLALIGLLESFEVIVGADDVTHPKPHAEPVEQALARLGVTTAGCLFVGDSHHDVFSGRAAGVGTVGVTWGPFDRAHLEASSPDFYCDAPTDLLTLLGV